MKRHYCTVSQSMFTVYVYSTLDGMGDLPGKSRIDGPFHVLSYRPWFLQVQELIDGSWRMLYSGPAMMRKVEALNDAARQGIDLDYVSHHEDDVESYVLN